MASVFSNRDSVRRYLSAVFMVLLFCLLFACAVPAAAGTGAQGGPAVGAPVVSVGPLAQAKTWEFERFDTDIKVNTDGSLTVRETQVANFTGSFSFLNRDLTSGKASFTEGRTYGNVRFKDIQVTDLNGQPYKQVKIEKLRGGKRVHISFSAFNEQKGWIIQYRMTGAIIYAPNYDRLYFNTVTTDRDVPIKSSRATVTLPAGTDMSQVKTKEYVSNTNPPSSMTSGVEGKTLSWESKNIAPFTTVTVDVAFPKGLVAVPLTFRAWFGAVVITLAAVGTIVVVLVMVLLWWRKGRDVAAPELDVVRYEPPPDLRPMEVGFLMNEMSLTSDITATIVDLAVRHKLVINEQEGSGMLKHKEFSFQRWDKSTEDLAPFEQEIMSGLFEGGDLATEDSLRNKFYTRIPDVDSKLKEQVLGKGLFDGDPSKVKGHYHWIGIVLLLLIIPVYFSKAWFDPGYLWVLIPALAVSGLAVMIVGHFMSRRTAKGSEAVSYVKGFKEYMSTAEREEMKFMTPENFQTNLPYAMALGVAGQWAGKFKDIYTSPPDWYRGYAPGTVFSTVYLADSLSSMQTSVGGTLMSSPSSSSSGGGGGFGGGFSGGGFGGGGSSAG
jgi:uncharacterized membrane protein YgcG